MINRSILPIPPSTYSQTGRRNARTVANDSHARLMLSITDYSNVTVPGVRIRLDSICDTSLFISTM